ncbi:MAG: phosphotransferase [Patescibacteria group bacterium]
MEINGQQWLYVKDRFLGRGRVYCLPDNSQYLRVGPIEKIAAEVAFLRQLNNYNFPVPKIINQGEYDNFGYYIEESVGQFSFGDRFRQEYLVNGRVSSETFSNYCKMSIRFLVAQFKSAKDANGISTNELRKGICVDNVVTENPDISVDYLNDVLSKVENKLKVLPLSLTHGDFSPFNVFNNGVVDFEHNFIGPIGYDVLTGPLYESFWDYKESNGESQLLFCFSEEQLVYYFNQINQVAAHYGISDFSVFKDSFLLLKAIWLLSYEKQLAGELGSNLRWNFRKAILKYFLSWYLDNKPIDTKVFKKLVSN